MSGSTVRVLTLQPASTAVREARHAVRDAVTESGPSELVDAALLATSELVTNAVVHAGTPVGLRITTEDAAVRVEVRDASPHLPVRRSRTHTAGTGRGLIIVDDQADRWGAVRVGDGKVVWFEIGQLSRPTPRGPGTPGPAVDPVVITLLRVPLLMHWAWQEHASSLLREYLLYALEDEPHALEEHARASDALRLLEEQIPAPRLPSDPAALIASSVEPDVTADQVELVVPAAAVPHFAVLDRLLTRAVRAAEAGHLLGPSTQPEIAEMREWLCGQVLSQSSGDLPVPWAVRTDLRSALASDLLSVGVDRDMDRLDVPALMANEAGLIVGVSSKLVELLRYDDASGLLGRRIVVVIPPRFHQAHIAGTTLHATNGRDVLLDRWIVVPALRADGTELTVELRVESRRSDDEHHFVAEFRAAEPTHPRDRTPQSDVQT